MNEEEYQQYCDMVFGMESFGVMPVEDDIEDNPEWTQLWRDDERAPGCYIKRPLDNE